MVSALRPLGRLPLQGASAAAGRVRWRAGPGAGPEGHGHVGSARGGDAGGSESDAELTLLARDKHCASDMEVDSHVFTAVAGERKKRRGQVRGDRELRKSCGRSANRVSFKIE